MPERDPRFPNRPDHPDFWRLSKVALAHDAIVDCEPDTESKLRALRDALEDVADPRSVDYMAEQRVLMALQKMGIAVSDRMEIILRATWVDAFRLGFAYAKQLEREAGDAPEF